MSKRTRCSTFLVVVALVPLVLGFASSASAAAKSSTSLYNCNQLTVRPSTLVLTCADSNRYVEHIHWSSWNASSARGTGTLRWNDCTPSCVSGHWHTEEISFLARDPKTLKGQRLFTELYGPSGAWGATSRVWILPTSSE